MLSSIPSWLSSRVEVDADNVQYILDNRTTQWASLFGLLTGIAIVIFVMRAWQIPGRIVPPVVAVFASLPILVGIIATTWSPTGGDRAARVIFSSPLRACAVALAIGAAAFVISILGMVLRNAGYRELAPYAGATFVLGLATVMIADAGRAVGHYGELPVIQLRGATEGHVGREWDVDVVLERETNRWWFFGWRGGGLAQIPSNERVLWHAPTSLHVRAEREGRNDVTVDAVRGKITARAKLKIEGHREKASPLFGLRVGNHYVYDVATRGHDGALFYFITLKGDGHYKERLDIGVVGTRERGPFRTFVIETRRDTESTLQEVVAVDGRTRMFDPDTGKLGEDAVAFIESSDAPYPDPVRCSFFLFGMSEATCQRGSRFSLPAPLGFRSSTGSTAGSIATGLLALITAGIIILPNGSSITYGLSHTDAGPEGAIEALPE